MLLCWFCEEFESRWVRLSCGARKPACANAMGTSIGEWGGRTPEPCVLLGLGALGGDSGCPPIMGPQPEIRISLCTIKLWKEEMDDEER
jgi:hypothetical protein